MFINFSNHPSDKWSDAQRDAAKEFGNIVDVPFPAVDPAGTEGYINSLAEECCQMILDASNNTKDTIVVHIMGEMTLTFAIIRRLQRKNITCLCSTTERVVEELDNGEKRALFNFVRFRKYAYM